jgi:hypothetical protein
VSRRTPSGGTALKVILVLVFVVVFLTVGVPRWLSDDAPLVGSGGDDSNFAKVCRDHGGTPATAPANGTGASQHRCTVRYGGRVYLMDAITPKGFDEDTARFQRQGCEEAERQERASTATGRRRSFVYHRDTGVGERRE